MIPPQEQLSLVSIRLFFSYYINIHQLQVCKKSPNVTSNKLNYAGYFKQQRCRKEWQEVKLSGGAVIKRITSKTGKAPRNKTFPLVIRFNFNFPLKIPANFFVIYGGQMFRNKTLKLPFPIL